MKKFNWSALYIFGLFLVGLVMIIWTIRSATSLPVQLDKTFFETKNEIDDKFNLMAEANSKFTQKYDIQFVYNDEKTAPLDLSEMFLAQRVVEEKGMYRNFLKVGTNKFAVIIKDKEGNVVSQNVSIHAMVTIASNNTNDIDLTNFEFVEDKFVSSFEVPRVSNWNVNGIVTVGEDKGYFFIKTNSK
ncbi:MAG: hypothetical protein RBR23_02130 [Arcobacteraceae bacterium]|jgi:hypothetical protein|nr:hypothetical protein [Arcobacteraceae bacterium]